MSDRFKLTQEEINKTIMHSPYALGSSPAQSGLGAKQIKSYFYDFISYLAYCINNHLGEIGTELDLTFKELTESDNGLRELIALAQERADSAYNLASGKSKMYVVNSFAALFAEMYVNEELNPGDLIMLTEKLTPDFVVIPKDCYLDGVEIIDVTWDTENRILPAEAQVGAVYRLRDNGVTVLAIEGGIDVSVLATKKELESAIGEIGRGIDGIIEMQSSLIGGEGQ